MPSNRRDKASPKAALLPAWNASVWWLRRRRGELAALFRGDAGRCSCCGRRGPWRRDARVLPPRLIELWGLDARLSAAFVRKESSFCAWCGASLRARRLAAAVLTEFPTGSQSLRAWTRQARARALRIAEINPVVGVHEALAGHPERVAAEFGSEQSEDLCALSFADDSIDLMLTSETLEHVHDLDRALAEIRRVLRPGGRHLFTVPWRPDVPRTFPRRPESFATIKHPGGDVGWPVVTEIGLDFPAILEAAGFSVTLRFGPVSSDDVAQVFATSKGAT